MIHEFRDEYRWLSNFAWVDIQYKGKTFPSVEHAYMSAKIDDEKWREFCTSKSNTAGQIKRITEEALKLAPLVDNWDTVKLEVMKECLWEKFNQEPFLSKLVETGNQNIQEGNYHKDLFWGVDLHESPNIGENHLGRLIMETRFQIINGF